MLACSEQLLCWKAADEPEDVQSALPAKIMSQSVLARHVRDSSSQPALRELSISPRDARYTVTYGTMPAT